MSKKNKKNKKPLTLKNAKSTTEFVVTTEVVSPVDGRMVEVQVALTFPSNRGMDAIDGLASVLLSGNDLVLALARDAEDEQAIEFATERGL